jgi:hypothetical protein
MTIALLSFLITIPSVSASTLEKESNYEIVYVDSLDEVQTDSKVNNMNDSQLTFYVSDNANESVIESKNMLLQKEENLIIDVNLSLLSKYSMNIDGKSISGEIYGTIYTSKEQLINQIEKVSVEYSNGIVRDSYESLSKSDYLTIGSDWYELDEMKVDVSLDYKGTHYGDFSEWRTAYKLMTINTTHDYYAFINESYIKPDTYKTDFRSDKLVYKFDPTIGAGTELRDYAPKVKGPEATVGYSVSVGGEISPEGGKVSSEISSSYSTLVKSPKLRDLGNMANNYAEIEFDYLNPYDNSGQYYEYNIGQSYQTSTFIIKAQKLNQDIVIKNDRVVTIVRDGFWSNTTVNFNVPGTFTIVR